MNHFSHLLSTWFQVIDLKPLHLSAHKFCSKPAYLELQTPSLCSESSSHELESRFMLHDVHRVWMMVVVCCCCCFVNNMRKAVRMEVSFYMSMIWLLWSFTDEETRRFPQMYKNTHSLRNCLQGRQIYWACGAILIHWVVFFYYFRFILYSTAMVMENGRTST